MKQIDTEIKQVEHFPIGGKCVQPGLEHRTFWFYLITLYQLSYPRQSY